MQFSFSDIWQHMGGPAIAVATVLMLMGMASLTVFVERLFSLRRSRKASRLFSSKVAEAVSSGRFDAAITEAEKHKHSHLARIFRAALVTYRHADRTADASALTPFDHTQRFLERYLEEVSSDLRSGLAVLASVGSTAPFVGLLGTVLGIISAFQGIASAGSGGLAAVSAGISEALIETALGLVVAIPAVLAFNYLSTKIGHEEMTLRNAAGHLLDTVEDHAERTALAKKGNGVRPARERLTMPSTGGGDFVIRSRKGFVGSRSATGNVQPDMNVTPLVDVVLVLLIIFMVVAPRLDQDVPIDLPGMHNPDPETKSFDPVKITIVTKDEYYYEENRLDFESLIQRLNDLHTTEPSRRLLLRADSKVGYGAVRQLLARCQEIGFPGVSLVVGERAQRGT